MRIFVLAFSLAVTLGLTACGSSAPTPSTQARTPPAALTDSQGASICNDLNAWLIQAMNEDQPRFTAKMESGQTEAGNTSLGTDLQTLDINLHTLNGAALFPSPPGYSPATGLGVLQQDCTAYGVNVHQPGS